LVRDSVIGLLLGESGVARAASPHPAALQKIIEFHQPRKRCTRWPDLHADAGGRVEHPRRYHRHDPGRHLDVDEATGRPILAILNADPTAVQRMPAVVNDDVLPDMGRMNG
jgi:hypothetical protein